MYLKNSFLPYRSPRFSNSLAIYWASICILTTSPKSRPISNIEKCIVGLVNPLLKTFLLLPVVKNALLLCLSLFKTYLTSFSFNYFFVSEMATDHYNLEVLYFLTDSIYKCHSWVW